jgi:hypothetical protein
MDDDMANKGAVVTVAITRDVIAGLDPEIHPPKNCLEDRWIRGSSPRMTTE